MGSRYTAVVCLIALAFSAPAAAQPLRKTTFVTGLTQPVAFVQDPSDPTVQYVVQQNGLIRSIRNGALQTAPFLDLRTSIASGGERGLLGLALPANYAVSGRAFVYFNDMNGDIVVARFKRSASNPLTADLASRFDLRWSTGLRVIRHPDFANHNGGNMMFGPDGFLYIGTGDGGSGNDPNHNAQNMSSLLGKMLRIDVSVADANTAGMAVPPDNPFPSSGAPEIWDIGLRNPWRWSFDDPSHGGTGALVIGDVGQGAWEEVDYEPAGRGGNNYGWRNREGAHNNVTSLPPAFTPLVDPIFEYPHPTGFSITGGYVYRGAVLGPAYRGRYFFADFVSAKIWSIALTIDAGTGRATASDLREHTADLTPGNVSAFGVDASGELYFVDYSNGAIVRITATPVPAMALDIPARNQTVVQPFWIAGWTVDPGSSSGAGIDTIHAWAYPIPALGAAPNGPPVFVGSSSLIFDRPDVAAAFGSSQFTRSGFGIQVTGLRPGSYTVGVFGLVHRTGSFDVAQVFDITVAPHTFVNVDVPGSGARVGGTFVIGGWAFDPAAPSGTGVDHIDVWAFPIAGGAPVFLGGTEAFVDRSDIGSIFGARFTRSGFNVVATAPPAGAWDMYVFARSTLTNTFEHAPAVRIIR